MMTYRHVESPAKRMHQCIDDDRSSSSTKSPIILKICTSPREMPSGSATKYKDVIHAAFMAGSWLTSVPWSRSRLPRKSRRTSSQQSGKPARCPLNRVDQLAKFRNRWDLNRILQLKSPQWKESSMKSHCSLIDVSSFERIWIQIQYLEILPAPTDHTKDTGNNRKKRDRSQRCNI